MPLTRRRLFGFGAAAAAGIALTGHSVGSPTAHARSTTAMRGLWLASVHNIDWPSATGLSAAQQRSELLSWLDMAVADNLNTIALQVRPTADAFWPGALEPWSQYLTGVQGRDPGWDPLGEAVTAAHERGLELHAWFNPYRVSTQRNLNQLVASHPARQNPDWVQAFGTQLYYNPGHPDAHAFVVDAIVDAVERYPIDAVHLDDYFYPYPISGQSFDDAAEYRRYGNGRSLADWRRSNITDFVVDLGDRITRARPGVQFGISPFGVWRNASTDPDGSNTRAGIQTYDDLYADVRDWVQRDLIDYVVPQIYWSRGFPAADYEELVPWWSDLVADTEVNLYIGQAAYKVGADNDPNWDDPAELRTHLDFNTGYPQVAGDFWFSAKDWRRNRWHSITRIRDGYYRNPASPPS